MHLTKSVRYVSDGNCASCVSLLFLFTKLDVENLLLTTFAFSRVIFFLFENYLGVTRKYSTFRFPDIRRGQKYYLGGTRK